MGTLAERTGCYAIPAIVTRSAAAQEFRSRMPISKIITLSEVESIALRVFKDNFIELAGEAENVARRRAASFTHTLVAALAEEAPDALGKASDPGFLQSVFLSQRHYALSGDHDLEAVLIQLLVSLVTAKSRSLREICVTEAIERAGKVTPSQLSILALLFVTTLVRWETIYAYKDFAKFVTDVIQPFCCADAADSRHYSHLSSVGCIEIGPAPREFEVFLMTHFRTLFSLGIPRDKFLESMDGAEQYLPLFETFDGDQTRLRFRFQTNESIKEAAVALGMSGSWRSTFQIDARYMMTSVEKIEHVKSLHAAIENLRQLWTAPHSLLPRSSLTTTGIAIAHSYLRSLKKAPAGLSQWL
jgi:hypothetical protein